jgi:hypothetical protein
MTSFGAIAQLGERLHGMQEVVGSNPIGSTLTDKGNINNYSLRGSFAALLNQIGYGFGRRCYYGKVYVFRKVRDRGKSPYTLS